MEEQLGIFVQNAYGHEAVMVHIPTDAYGDSFGYAFAEFETEAIAKVCCRTREERDF